MDFNEPQKEVRQKMKKILSFTFAALLAVTSYSLADEFADLTDEIDAELTQAVENMTERENPQAESAQTSAPVASQAAMPQKGQKSPQTRRAPQPPMPPWCC